MTNPESRFRRYVVWVAFVSLALTFAQATARPAEADQQAGTIADVGESPWTMGLGEMSVTMYRYENLMVSGDILLEDYREVLATVKAYLPPNERPTQLRTHTNPKDTHFGFLTVKTTADPPTT